MPTRHVTIKLSAAATSSQKARILTLALQNVTNFSTYTADSYIGTWITAGNTVTVNAIGDTIPFTVVQDTTTVSTNVKAVVKLGNLDYIITGITGATQIAYIAPTLFGSADANTIKTNFSGLDFHFTVSDSFFAAYNASSLVVAPPASDFSCIDNGRLVVVSATSVNTTVSTVAAYTKLTATIRKSATVSSALGNIITNFGASSLLSYQYIDPVSKIAVKPVLKFSVFETDTNTMLTLSDTHGVRALAYDLFTNTGYDYSRTVVNGGTTYLAVGNFLFAS